MPLKRIEAANFTVFEDINIDFCKGLNVFIGENGMGKTHIMKLLYAACWASKHDVSFSQKSTMQNGCMEFYAPRTRFLYYFQMRMRQDAPRIFRSG